MTAVKAVVFDWAGTMIDFGSRAPVAAFVEAFRQFGVGLSESQARGPMGMPKLDHIRQLGRLDAVRSQWRAAHGSAFDEEAAQKIHEVFVPLSAKVVTDCADLVPGAADMARELRADGIRIGSTTGYTRTIMAPLLPPGAEQGYAPDNLVCAGDLWTGRSTPVMMWKCFLDLEIDDPATVIKVDDTAAGLAEGWRAGTWAVGVSMSGNEVGLTPDELASLPATKRDALRSKAGERLRREGAHFVIDTVADLRPVIGEISEKLTRGQGPQ